MKHFDLIVKARQGGEEMRQVYCLGLADQTSEDAVANAVTQLRGWFYDIWRPASSDSCVVYEIAARSVDVAGLPEVPYWTGSIVGGASAEPLPRVLCGVLNLRSVTARPNKGRKFFFGATEGHNVAPGVPSYDYKNVLGAFGQALLDFNAGILAAEFVIPRRASNGTVIESNIITASSPSDRWGYQRRRSNGR